MNFRDLNIFFPSTNIFTERFGRLKDTAMLADRKLELKRAEIMD